MSDITTTKKEAAEQLLANRKARKAWAQEFRKGLAKHRKSIRLEKQRNQPGRNLDPAVLKLTEVSNLSDDDVINAIGTFWIALRGNDSLFGYGDAALFKNGRDSNSLELELLAKGVVPLSRQFIMPLLFTEDEAKAMRSIKKHAQIKESAKTPSIGSTPRGVVKNSSGKTKNLAVSSKHSDSSAPDSNCIGHFLLAVSTLKENNSISTELLDSKPGYVKPLVVTDAYRGLVTHSGWLGLESDGSVATKTPNFNAASTPTAPTQLGYNACGLYVILNAWASMLGIPITKNRWRRVRGCRGYKEFHSLALEIVNLALRGYMDSVTVQAFMIVYGYTELIPTPPGKEQEAGKDAKKAVTLVHTKRMESGTLAVALEDQGDVDKSIYSS